MSKQNSFPRCKAIVRKVLPIPQGLRERERLSWKPQEGLVRCCRRATNKEWCWQHYPGSVLRPTDKF
ncbi:MAG: hypothetical protein A2139_14205 [Desulfobacca sp. RBG_16_60_12]|nr:MAG: hypothetical protein A2139_14205 [Desulfobacca sp. RBG_16_60_12]